MFLLSQTNHYENIESSNEISKAKSKRKKQKEKAKRRLTENEAFNLLCVWLQEECLFNFKHKGYHNTTERNVALQNISITFTNKIIFTNFTRQNNFSTRSCNRICTTCSRYATVKFGKCNDPLRRCHQNLITVI